jgi:Zn-finger protein
MKKCTVCKEEKEITEFYKKSKGTTSACRKCLMAQTKKYKQENKDKIREYNRKYKQENKEKLRDNSNRYSREAYYRKQQRTIEIIANLMVLSNKISSS